VETEKYISGCFQIKRTVSGMKITIIQNKNELPSGSKMFQNNGVAEECRLLGCGAV
jgi:hypothetical protein